jgi:hypothetical protein
MNTLQTFIQTLPCGFITAAQMSELIKLDRLCPVLVRCGCGRFTCAAQDVAHFIKCVEAGGDYVRDVSLPVGSMERAANWAPEPASNIQHQATGTRAAGLLGVTPKHLRANRAAYWDESQCGGVFDGHQVASDADSGL